MKVIILAIAICFSAAFHAQGVEDFFTPDYKMTWMGIDFSHAQYFGETGTVSADEMKTLFHKINDLILYEPEKFDLPHAFKKYRVGYDLKAVWANNDAMDPATIISHAGGNTHRFNRDSIRTYMENYQIGEEMAGIGLVLFTESLDKTDESFTCWITAINLDTREILLTEKMEGLASGIGFRNHWANAVNDILREVRFELPEWKKKYTEQIH